MNLQTLPYESSTPVTSRRERILRGLLIVLCVLSTAAVAANYLSWRSQHQRLLGILAQARVDEFNETAIRRLQYEASVQQAQTLAARALVHQVMNFDVVAGDQQEWTQEEQLRGLKTAEELAQSALAAQPNNWQAAMFLGAARYLGWSIERDRRLFNNAAAWEAPLRQAVEVTGGKIEPRRLLAAAYLETWWALSAEKKLFAQDLLASVFQHDEAALVRLVPRWLETANSQDEAFALIPDTPSAWQVLRFHYSRAEDWPSVARVHRRWLSALEGSLKSKLEEAVRRLRLGDLGGARTLCLEVVALAPPHARFAPLAARALELYPPGLNHLQSTAPLADWLRFTLALDLQGRELISPVAVNRLSDLLEDLEPPLRLHAALLGNDTWRLRGAEKRLQRHRVWAPFLLAQARRQITVGDLDAASASLARVDPLSERQLPYLRLRHQLASAGNDPAARATADQGLAPFRRRHWTALDWQGDSHRSQLFFLLEEKGAGLRVAIVNAPDQGGVVEILLDGDLIDVRAVRKKRRYEITVPITEGLHLLETRGLGNQRILPGPVELF